MRSSILALALLAGCGAAGASELCHPTASLSMPAYRCGGATAAAAGKAEPTEHTDDNVTSTTESESTTDEGTSSGEDTSDAKPKREVWLADDTIAVKDTIAFEDGTATLTDDAQIALLEVAKFLDGHSELSRVQIGVHADAPKKKAQKLSDAQAKAVKDFLVAKGIDKGRLVAKGLGKGDAEVELTVLAHDE